MATLMAVAVPAVGSAAGVHRSPVETKIEIVYPVTASGLAAGYHVVESHPGECNPPSLETFGRVYTCEDAKNLLDPCWVLPSDHSRRTAVCTVDPSDVAYTM